MKYIYTDLHIHTSENADKLINNYDVNTLLKNIGLFSEGSEILISLTDHNTVNQAAYKELLDKDVNFLVGVELHIRNYKKEDPYHCHIYFNLDIDETLEEIIKINEILDHLYPKKMVTPTDKIPFLEDIVKNFDDYDFMMLPHGGQSHRTFDKTIPDGKKFDSVIERNIYYNQFDGFTSRSNTGLERTQSYFKRLGILSFINLITCTDNYNPSFYPATKAKNAESFIPTWMLSQPTFSGLRLALSESTRLFYQINKPKTGSDFIKNIKLNNELIDIDVKLTQGLNVIIGGSSSGKTLFLDSLHRKIYDENLEEDYTYSKFSVKDMIVENPAGYKPHYISQNYITKVIDENYEDGIEKIDIIKNTFKGDKELDERVNFILLSLKKSITGLISSVKEIENIRNNLRKIPSFPRIIAKEIVNKNPFQEFIPNSEIKDSLVIKITEYESYIQVLDSIVEMSKSNPFMKDISFEVEIIKKELTIADIKYRISTKIIEKIEEQKVWFDNNEMAENRLELINKNNRENLLKLTKKYITNIKIFNESLSSISSFSFSYQTKPIISQGHKLYIENNFKLDKEIFVTSLNHFLKTNNKIQNFDKITPEAMYESNFSKRNPKVKDYKDFEKRLFKKIESTNENKYNIVDKNGNDFNNLSPGWRTAVILDIVLGYSKDVAPIFIDQPEDNLATNYINDGLVESIKMSKGNRQIIVITHNATIPMLADAQNIIYCHNDGKKIVIRSNPMEGKFDNKSVIDYIVEITDGGKASVKKRVKKYNLKTFREDK